MLETGRLFYLPQLDHRGDPTDDGWVTTMPHYPSSDQHVLKQVAEESEQQLIEGMLMEGWGTGVGGVEGR